MSELITRLREILAALAASDPQCKRFGAVHHRYLLAPPLEEHALAKGAPEDLVEYATRLSGGGVGPYYGLVRLDRAPVIAAPPGVTTWTTALAISHLGCGYCAVVPLDGAAHGQVWLDARPLAVCQPVRPSFTAFVLDWVDRVAHGRWLDGFVPTGRCALAAAMTGYLGVCEQRLGIPAGSLDGEPLREALADLGRGAIEIAAEEGCALFAPGERVDPCATCARWVEGLGSQGLRPDVVAPGLAPVPDR